MGEQSYKKNNSQPNKNGGGEIKIMKKVLNLFLVFALLLTMVTPAFAATELTTEAKFQALVDAGILSGNADGSFGLEDNLSRAALAKVAVNIKGLDPLPGEAADFDESQAHWGYTQGWIQAAVAAGLMKGGVVDGKSKFRPNDDVTYEEMVIVLVRSLDLEDEVKLIASVDGKASSWAKGYLALAIEQGLVAAQADYTVDATRADMATQSYESYQYTVVQTLTVDSVNVVDATNVEFTMSNGEVVAKVLDTALVANTATDVTVEYLGVSFTESATLEYLVLAVDSVSALNLVEYEVVFTKAVDELTLGTADFTSATAVALQEDGKTVLVTVGLKGQQSTLDVTVKDIDDLDGNTIDDTTVEGVEFFDATIPFATSIELTGPQSFEVTYNEPVQGSPTALINDGIYGAAFVSIVGNVVKYDFTSTLDEGEYTIKVDGVTDFATYAAPAKTYTLTYATNTTVPTVSIDSATQEKVTVLFSKPVKNITAANFNHTFSAWNPLAVEDVDGGAVVATNYYEKVVLTFATDASTGHPLVEGTNKVNVLVGAVDSEIQDKWGNMLAADVSFTVNVVADQTAPTVTLVEATDEDIIEITFSEDVTGAVFTAYDADGDEVATGSSTTYNSTDYVYTIDYDSDLAAGAYTVEIKDATDASIYTNEMVTVTKSFTITDLTAPVSPSAEYVVDGSNYLIYVTYPEKMNSADILNKDNYRLASAVLGDDDTIVLFGDSSKVKITTATNPLGLDLTLKNVADTSGNAIDLFTTLTAANIQAASAPVSNGIKTLGLNKIEVTFDQHLSGAPSSAFEVNNVVPASAVYVNNDDDTSTLTLTLQSTGVLSGSADTTVVLDVVTANAVKSYTGQAITPADGIGGAVTDGIAPAIVSATVDSATQITLVFDEALEADTFAGAATLNGFSVAGGDATITAAAISVLGVDGITVVITGTNFVADTTTVSYTAGYLTDVAGNELASFSDQATN